MYIIYIIYLIYIIYIIHDILNIHNNNILYVKLDTIPVSVFLAKIFLFVICL